MKIHNHMTYININELYHEFQKSYNHYKQEELNLMKDQIINLVENKVIDAIRLNDEWFVNELDASHYVHTMINKERSEKVFYGGRFGFDLSDTKLEGRILDLGGGGEGVIGQLKGEQVIAIDPNKGELEQAPEGGLKIVMDGKDLKFLDHTFDTATSFFTLMYIPKADHKQVLSEIYRVLKTNGEFVMWDINIPQINEPQKEYFGVYLEVHLPKKIQTGYGVRLRELQKEDYIELAKSVGFEIVEAIDYGITAFSIRFIKR
ncbi:class I SAM-dependent methyltransferase [Brassicibacter mesophilus]|uniref:class I SAM-dependent methyltransferase n=1 Tax=Brassicibacter mesophilus TaxID=745119 RepID=UPI003D1F67B6